MNELIESWEEGAGIQEFFILTAEGYEPHQEALSRFLSGPIHQHYKWLAPVAVVLFIPLVAYLWGTVTGLALKIINID